MVVFSPNSLPLDLNPNLTLLTQINIKLHFPRSSQLLAQICSAKTYPGSLSTFFLSITFVSSLHFCALLLWQLASFRDFYTLPSSKQPLCSPSFLHRKASFGRLRRPSAYWFGLTSEFSVVCWSCVLCRRLDCFLAVISVCLPDLASRWSDLSIGFQLVVSLVLWYCSVFVGK